MSAPTSEARVFRLPKTAYLVVLFLFAGAIPLSFAADGQQGAPAAIGAQSVIILVPVLAAAFVARTATIVGPSGITVRALFGNRRLGWPDVRGLSITKRSVYAVLADGSVRLPCVNVGDLGSVARASAGHLPPLADPVPKAAPSRSRRL